MAGDLPPAWEELDWRLFHDGSAVGGLHLDYANDAFTTSKLSHTSVALGNPGELPVQAVLESVSVTGGQMATARQLALGAAPVVASALTTQGEGTRRLPPPVGADGAIPISVPPGQIVWVTLNLPRDLDPGLPKATRGTCYTLVLTGRVGHDRFQRQADHCYGERRPLTP